MALANQKKPHWSILGPGAIGCLWAGYWAQQQQNSSLIGRQAHPGPLQLLRHGNTQTFTIETQTAEQLTQPIDYLLITTKAQQTQPALDSVQPWLSDGAIIIVLQNGMAATEISTLPQQKLFAATTTDGAHRTRSRHIIHAGIGQTSIGPLSASAMQFGERIMALLPTQLHINYSDNIRCQLWQKLAISCAINGLTVLHQCRNGELLNITQARQSISDLCQEIIAVTQALKLGQWFTQLEHEVEQVLILTADNISSMQQDIRQGRRTEINQINGYLCRQAEQLGIALPHNQALLKAVQNIEATLDVLPSLPTFHRNS